MRIIYKFINAFLVLLLFHSAGYGQGIQIIPQPAKVIERSGFFKYTNETRIVFIKDAEIEKTVQLFLEQVFIQTGIKAGIVRSGSREEHPANTISVLITDSSGKFQNKESYELDIKESSIQITASDGAGLFYAFQSLLQLIPPERNKRDYKSISFPAVTIYDYPRFSYRGMHLDVSRHFFPASFIKNYLDILARYKINTFHWHITDSHGWRLEIKKYPKLTSVGSWRADRTNIPMTIALPTQPGEATTYGGFYTQEEVKEIVQYAKDRFIVIIPEIEMPGHCTAAVVAYPEYTCLDNPIPLLMPTGYAGDLLHNFCAGYDSTFFFLNDILDEVMELFPSQYIHIGGDEVKGASWLSCRRCRQRMNEKGYTTTRQLQAYFTDRIDSFITAKGRKSIGWDEILEAGNLSSNAAVMSWRGTAGGIEGAKKGHKVVMTPHRYTYFDFYQSDPELEPHITYAALFLDSVYAFNPIAGLADKAAENVLGAQACLWTENVSSEEHVTYMLLPRLLALAEVAWSPAAQRDYRQFIDKLEKEFLYFDREKINYATSLYNVSIRPYFDTSREKTIVSLRNQVAGKYPIYYTIDGSEPTAKSLLYQEPIVVQKTTTVRAGLFNNGKRLGKINSKKFSVHNAIGISSHVLPATKDAEALAAYQKITDGIFGTIEPYDGRWVFFRDSSVTVTIDLGKVIPLNKISFRLLEDKVGNAFLPGEIIVSISNDERSFRNVAEFKNSKAPQQDLRHIADYEKAMKQKGRFIKIHFRQSKSVAGNPPEQLLFLDEVVID